MADAAERALYAEHVSQAILCGRMDVEVGNCVEGIDAAKSAVALRHSSGLSDHGQADTHQPFLMMSRVYVHGVVSQRRVRCAADIRSGPVPAISYALQMLTPLSSHLFACREMECPKGVRPPEIQAARLLGTCGPNRGPVRTPLPPMDDDSRARESAGYRRSDVFPVEDHLIVPQKSSRSSVGCSGTFLSGSCSKHTAMHRACISKDYHI